MYGFSVGVLIQFFYPGMINNATWYTFGTE